MSKLQLLAQRRKLEKLAHQAPETPLAPQNEETPSSRSSGLSKLLQKRKLDASTAAPSPSQGKPSAMASLLARKKAMATDPVEGRTLTPSSTTALSTSSTTSSADSSIATVTPAIDLSVFTTHTASNQVILPTPTHILPQIIFSKHYHSHSDSIPQPKRRKVQVPISGGDSHIDTNIPFDIADKIKKNFQTPSPDDKRKIVESLSNKVSKVEINENTPAKKKLTVTKPKSKIDLTLELSKKTLKPLLSAIVIGHVDSGKSTTIGRLLYDLGIVDSRTLHKLTRDAELAGKGSFSLAWVMDQTPEERSRGVTIDIVQTQFETETARFAIIDSPGHKDYLPQMINGITQADVAVVILDSTSDLIFEAASSFSSNNNNAERTIQDIAKGQTFEQLTIAKNMGIEKVVLLVNKMDVSQWDQERFNSIETLMKDYLVEQLDFKPENLNFVPTSGFQGDNIVKKSDNCTWYQGPTLIQYLEQLNSQFNENFKDSLSTTVENPFVLTITDITQGSSLDSGNSNSSLVSTGGKKTDTITVQGRVNNGLLQPGESVQFWPSAEFGQVDSITTTISKTANAKSTTAGGTANDKIVEKLATLGEFVELKVRKVELPDAISIGDLVTKVVSDNSDPFVKCSDKFVCELRMFGLSRPVLVGTPFVLFKGNVSYSAKLSEIEWVEMKTTDVDGNIILKKSKKRKHLSSGQRAKVIIETDKSIPVTESINKLNRIVLRKEGLTVGAGKIKSAIIS